MGIRGVARLAALIGVLAGTGAGATLIGDDIVIQRIAGGTPTVWNFPVTVVEGDFELDFVIRHDIEAESILLTSPNASVGFDGTIDLFDYQDLDWLGQPGEITGFTLTTNISGLDEGRIGFTADSVSVDLTGLSMIAGVSFATIDLQVAHVPELSTIALLGMGLAALARGRRRRPHQAITR